MNDTRRLEIEDLQRLYTEGVTESLILEFKSCDELKVGSRFYDKKIKAHRNREIEDVLNELTRDVTALLNSAGGTIIYGIKQNNNGRARDLDKEESFKAGNKRDNIYPEKVTDWLRAYIQPPPAVDVYQVFDDRNNPMSPWYLVIETSQGQLAYMAKDHRFYKRVANSVKPMEQYEIVDVMNRTRGALLDLRLEVHQQYPSSPAEKWTTVVINMAVTSLNFIASEYGALKITIASPLKLQVWVLGPKQSGGLLLDGQDEQPHAVSVSTRWGANAGSVIFPGDWYNFRNEGLYLDVPNLSLANVPTYLIQAELFTTNSQSRRALFALEGESRFDLVPVTPSAYSATIARFWETYHAAGEKLIYGS